MSEQEEDLSPNDPRQDLVEENLYRGLSDEMDEAEKAYGDWQQMLQIMADLPARESSDDRKSRLEVRKITTLFAMAVLSVAIIFLIWTAATTTDELTKQWAQTLLAGIVGGLVSFLLGTKS